MAEISTHALLDLIGLPTTTGNARRISKTMRSAGIYPDQVTPVHAGWLSRHRKPRLGASDAGFAMNGMIGCLTTGHFMYKMIIERRKAVAKDWQFFLRT